MRISGWPYDRRGRDVLAVLADPQLDGAVELLVAAVDDCHGVKACAAALDVLAHGEVIHADEDGVPVVDEALDVGLGEVLRVRLDVVRVAQQRCCGFGLVHRDGPDRERLSFEVLLFDHVSVEDEQHPVAVGVLGAEVGVERAEQEGSRATCSDHDVVVHRIVGLPLRTQSRAAFV